MTNVSEWNVSAGLNNASPPDGWPEGMQRSAVNDTAREMMAALARWYSDVSGTLVTAGGTTAYSLTTNCGYGSLADIPMLLVRSNATNTGAMTLNIDALGATNLTKADGTALGAGDFIVDRLYVVVYNSAASRLELVNTVTSDTFPASTTMGFIQASVPTGWTKSVSSTYDNKALRLTTGTPGMGGSSSFTSVFSTRTITQAALPSFNLAVNLSTGTVVKTAVESTGGISTGSDHYISSVTTGTSPVTGTVNMNGSNAGLDFNVAYVDMIVGVKN